MFGEIGAWLYKALGGIKPDPQHPGFKNILLEPHFSEGLDHFEAAHRSPFGNIFSSWKKEKGKTFYTVIIPPNATATLLLPVLKNQILYKNGKLILLQKDGLAENIPAGKYLYEWQ